MLEKHELKVLSDAVRDSWKDVNFARVNGLDVRFRVVMDGRKIPQARGQRRGFLLPRWRRSLDTADGATTALRTPELVVVPRYTLHRLRVEGRAVVLVIVRLRGEPWPISRPS